MMASDAQILANRKNAQKSTGPRTEEGKAVSAQNAVTHGLLARQDVIQSEEQADFDRLREEMLRELAPAGPVETPLAERIVSLMWRLKRAQRLQNEVFDYLTARNAASSCVKHIHSTSPEDPRGDPGFVLGRVVVEDLSNSRVIDRLGLYERRIETSLYRTMRELRMVKALRASGTTEKAGDQRAEGRDQGPVAASLRPDIRAQSPVTPCGVTTNGELCETKPILSGDGSACRVLPASGETRLAGLDIRVLTAKSEGPMHGNTVSAEFADNREECANVL